MNLVGICTQLMHRSILANHVGRSYAFELNPEVVVDAGEAGNESRFINHGDDKEANVSVYSVSHFILYVLIWTLP